MIYTLDISLDFLVENSKGAVSRIQRLLLADKKFKMIQEHQWRGKLSFSADWCGV